MFTLLWVLGLYIRLIILRGWLLIIAVIVVNLVILLVSIEDVIITITINSVWRRSTLVVTKLVYI